MTNDVGTPGSRLRQAQQCGRFTLVNVIKPSHLFNLSTAWISNRNLKKPDLFKNSLKI